MRMKMWMDVWICVSTNNFISCLERNFIRPCHSSIWITYTWQSPNCWGQNSISYYLNYFQPEACSKVYVADSDDDETDLESGKYTSMMKYRT